MLRKDLPEDAVLEEEVEGGDAILPRDLLPFLVGATVVRDGDFVDAALLACGLDRDLRLKTKTIGGEFDVLDDLAAEELVSDLHVAQVQIRQQVREEGEELIDLKMPEIQNAMLSAVKPVAEDNVGAAGEHGGEQDGV